MANKRKNVVGEKRGRLTAIEMTTWTDGKSGVVCICDCGKRKVVSLQNFGKSVKSCGCLQKEVARKHGREMVEKGVCQRPDAKDIVGRRFNMLTVISRAKNKNGRVYWNCVCDCGIEKSILGQNLTNGSTKSCGCFNRNSASIRMKAKQHRDYDTKTRIYEIWRNMRRRCSEKGDVTGNYFKRGIIVCKEWNKYELFMKWAMSNGYNDSLTIDRIDNNKGYFPENCRWTSYMAQANNTRANHLVTYKGETMTMAQWARKLGISYAAIKYRVSKNQPLKK